MKTLLLIFLLIFNGCDSSKEDRLGFGISKQQADKILLKNGPIFSEADTYCVDEQYEEIKDVQLNKIENRYYINNLSSKSLRYFSVKFYKRSNQSQVQIGWKYFSDTDFDQFGNFNFNTTKEQNCFPLGEEIGIKGKALGSYVLFLPEDKSLSISEIKLYSNTPKPKGSCSYKQDLNHTEEAYQNSKDEPGDKNKFLVFFKSVLKIIKVDDCKREIDPQAVPKYYFCGYDKNLKCDESSPRRWFRHLKSYHEKYPLVKKLFQSKAFVKYLRDEEAEFKE